MGIPNLDNESQPQDRLLVVDDSKWNLDLMRVQMSKRGYEVHCAQSGFEALDLIKVYSFDLVLLDIMMPEMSGLEMLAQVRKQHSMLNLPIIMVTADDLQEHIIEALRLGANDYIVKPLDMSVAGARIQTQLTLKKLAAMKDQFIKFASHDLKKPLIVSLDIIKTLENECTPGTVLTEDSSELLTMVHKSCENMQHVIEGFLDNGQISDNPVKIINNLNPIVEQCVNSNIEYGKQKQVELKSELATNPPNILGNEFQIMQILDNLIGNAIKFSPSHTTTTISTRYDQNYVYVDISDEGPGLTDEDFKILFTPNKVLSNKPTGNETSSGVGLGLSKQLIEIQSGRIGARNNAGKGVTFWIGLPIQKSKKVERITS